MTLQIVLCSVFKNADIDFFLFRTYVKHSIRISGSKIETCSCVVSIHTGFDKINQTFY